MQPAIQLSTARIHHAIGARPGGASSRKTFSSTHAIASFTASCRQGRQRTCSGWVEGDVGLGRELGSGLSPPRLLPMLLPLCCGESAGPAGSGARPPEPTPRPSARCRCACWWHRRSVK